jgi:hypothetical protein
MPSAVRFGAGFGKDPKYLDQRPCNEFISAEWQKSHNDFFQRDSLTKAKFQDPRPPWFSLRRADAEENTLLPPSPGRLGEWKIKWIPKEGASPNQQALGQKKSDVTIRDSMYGPLVLQPTKEHLNPARKFSNSNDSKNFASPTLCRVRSKSSLDAVVSAHSADESHPTALKSLIPRNEEFGRDLLQLDTQNLAKNPLKSGRSGQSSYYTSCTGFSCSVSDRSGILQRVKALEDALKGEKAMREKLQEILHKVGDKRLPGVSLPYVASKS